MTMNRQTLPLSELAPLRTAIDDYLLWANPSLARALLQVLQGVA